MQTPFDQRGDLLLDALLALTLLGFVALGAVGLGHSAVHLSGEAAHLDAALNVSRQCLADLDQVGWHRLPQYFGAAGSAQSATLDTDVDHTPPEWLARAATLPWGKIVVRLEGLVRDGDAAAFDASIALRVSIVVSYRESQQRRHVTVRTVRL